MRYILYPYMKEFLILDFYSATESAKMKDGIWIALDEKAIIGLDIDTRFKYLVDNVVRNMMYQVVATSSGVSFDLPVIVNPISELNKLCKVGYDESDARVFFDDGRNSVLKNHPVADVVFHQTITNLGQRRSACWVDFDPQTLTVK